MAIPPSIRKRLSLPPTDKGIDGVFETHGGDLVAYQAKFRTDAKALNWGDVTAFFALAHKANERLIFTNSDNLRAIESVRRCRLAARTI